MAAAQTSHSSSSSSTDAMPSFSALLSDPEDCAMGVGGFGELSLKYELKSRLDLDLNRFKELHVPVDFLIRRLPKLGESCCSKALDAAL